MEGPLHRLAKEIQISFKKNDNEINPIEIIAKNPF